MRPGPESPDGYRNLWAVLTQLRRAAEAEPVLRIATRLAPDAPEAHFIPAQPCTTWGAWEEPTAPTAKRRACGPDFADADNKRAYSLLLAGRYSEGWREYEWRWRTKHMAGGARGFAAPRWMGAALQGRTLFVHADQGLGDTLQFCRYAPLIIGAGRVIIEMLPSFETVFDLAAYSDRDYRVRRTLAHF